MRYGIPYKGSKNSIAQKIIDILPAADTLYDIFCGGCAVTHCAMTNNKYKHYVINDIDGKMPQFFADVVAGKYSNENRWISREDFKNLKDIDAYVATCWSFGNNCRNYLYSRSIEPWKKAYHYAVIFDDVSEFEKFGIKVPHCSGDRLKLRKYITENQSEFKAKYEKWCAENIARNSNLSNLESLQRLQSLERLESLENLEIYKTSYSLEIYKTSYSNVPQKRNGIIYCDIPYKNTDKYSVDFDYEAFYNWCEKQTLPLFISEYDMPENRFRAIATFEKRQLLYGQGTGKRIYEKLFVPIKQHQLL